MTPGLASSSFRRNPITLAANEGVSLAFSLQKDVKESKTSIHELCYLSNDFTLETKWSERASADVLLARTM